MPHPKPSSSSGGQLDRNLKILAGAVSVFTLLVAILNSGAIADWFRARFPPKDPYAVEISQAKVVPAYLKYYYDAEGLGALQSLYWFRMKVTNKTRASLSLEISFTLLPSDCRFVVLKSKDPYVYSLRAGETKEETITPPLEFTKNDFADECYVKVNWIIENKQKEKAYRTAGVSEIKLLPVGKVKWDLVNPAGNPVAPEFLFASLAAWSLSREGTVLKRADQLRQRTQASAPQEWVRSCYGDLFAGPSALVLDATARTYPFVGEKTVATPRKVLSEGEAEPLEAAFLMAAMIRAATVTHRARLTLFVLPRAEAPRDPSVLLAWSLPNTRVWEAVDLREARNLSFDANVQQSRKRLSQLLAQQPEFLASLRARGVFAAANTEPKALSFDRAVEEFRIRALE